MTQTTNYRLEKLADLGSKLGFPTRRIDSNTVEVTLATEVVLIFSNLVGEDDTIAGFAGSQSHFHGSLSVMAGEDTLVEYDELEILAAIVEGELVVVSRFVGGNLNDRWLAHRLEQLDLRYIQEGEEMRIQRIVAPVLAEDQRVFQP